MSRGKTDFLAPYREEEDSAEETLLRDPPSDQRPPENQDTGTQNQRSGRYIQPFQVVSRQQARIS